MSRVSQIGQCIEVFSEQVRTSAWRRYGVASVLVLAAFGLRYWFAPILGDDLPFVFFLTSSILAAWFGGFGAGFYALAFGLVLGDYFFLPPIGSLGDYHPYEWTLLISAVIPDLISISLIEFLHRTRHRRKREAQQLKREVQHRRKVEGELRAAEAELKRHAADLENRVHERTMELQSSVRFLEGYCYSIAHNLRAPLRAMTGFAEALAEDYSACLDDTGKDYTKRINAAATRMDRMVLDLLEYGRVSHVRVTLEDVNLDRTIDAVLATLAKQIQARKAVVRVSRPLTPVRADAKLLERVLSHVIQNAFTYVSARVVPIVSIWTTEPRMGTVRLCVKDNGIGIPREHHRRIFKMFERLSSNPQEWATGAGLAISEKAVERMRGAIGLYPDPGGGSCFWIDLPSAAATHVAGPKLQPWESGQLEDDRDLLLNR